MHLFKFSSQTNASVCCFGSIKLDQVIHFNILLTVPFSQKEMLWSLRSTLFLAVEVNN